MENSGRQPWATRLRLLSDDDLEASSDSELETSGLCQDSPEGTMCCLNCSRSIREKKLSLARSKQFCSLHCMQEWKTKHSPKEKSESDMCRMAGGSKRTTRSSTQTAILSVSTHTPKDVQQLPAKLRILYIDMASPGSTLPQPVDSEEEPYSWVTTPPTAAQSASSARIEKKGSRRKGTSKGEIEPPPKRRRTEPLKQIQRTEKKVYRRKRCGKCTACCREDCGTCVQCRDKKKFGGKCILKKPCIHRVCKHLKCKPEQKKRKGQSPKRAMHSSSASESEQDDPICNQADREISIDSQVKEAVQSDETIGYSDCPSGSESESVMSGSMLVKIPYQIAHPQLSRSPVDNSSTFVDQAPKGRETISTCTRSDHTAEESNLNPEFRDSEEVEDTGTQSLQFDEIFTRFETHAHDFRAQLEETLRQKESENTRLSKQLQEKEQANKQQKWLKAVALPKTSMPEQMKVIVKEHQLKVQEKMEEIADLNEKCERLGKQLQEQEDENTQLRGLVKQQDEENTQLTRQVKQQDRQLKRLQEEISKLKEATEQLEEARRIDRKTIQEKEEQNKEIKKLMEKISNSLS